MRRLLLVRHGPTSATRTSAFPVDEPLDDAGRLAAGALAAVLPRNCDVLCSPALRCRQTAAAAGLQPQLDELLAECDFGRWAGLRITDLDAGSAGEWMTDPAASPHGGESLGAFAARIAAWLDAQAHADGAAAAITHAGVVKAAVVHALGAPLDAFWCVDAAPLSITELHARDGRWTLTRLNHPVSAP